MSRTRLAISTTAVAVGLLLLSACGPGSGSDGSDSYGAGANQAPAPVAQQSEDARLVAVDNDGLGQVLTDQDGFTLYRFDEDTAKPPKSNCDGECAAKWPPMLADGDVQVEGVEANVVGSVTRTDGTKQVTVGGWPLYRYVKDTGPGQVTGHGVGETWFAVTPTGAKAGAEAQPPAQTAALNATDIPGFGAALTDQDGFTLYLFTKDTKDPSKSNCDGECAELWPPVPASDDLQLSGVDPNIVSTVTRTDGSEQVTVGGWPVYRYAKDTAAGQTTGHGVGGTWFVIEAAGCKSKAPVAPAPAEDSDADNGGY